MTSTPSKESEAKPTRLQFPFEHEWVRSKKHDHRNRTFGYKYDGYKCKLCKRIVRWSRGSPRREPSPRRWNGCAGRKGPRATTAPEVEPKSEESLS